MSDGLWSKDAVCTIPAMKEQAVVFFIRQWMQEYIAENSILAEQEKPEDYIRIRAIEDGTLVRGELSVRLPPEERETYPYGEYYPFVHPWFRALIHPTVEGGVCVEIAYTDGDALMPMAEALLVELRRLSPQARTRTARSEVSTEIPKWMPTRDTALEKWRSVYRVLQEYLKDLSEAADRGEEAFSPSYQDHREYLGQPPNFKRARLKKLPSTKLIGHILEAGVNGWLSKKSQ